MLAELLGTPVTKNVAIGAKPTAITPPVPRQMQRGTPLARSRANQAAHARYSGRLACLRQGRVRDAGDEDGRGYYGVAGRPVSVAAVLQVAG